MGCGFEILTPLQEAQYELLALRRECTDTSVAMLSMGGRSMQLGREDALFSLPFAMFLGLEELQKPGRLWKEAVASVQALYDGLAISERSKQEIPLVEGTIVGVTDTLDVATPLNLLHSEVSVTEFI